jgi:integrase/recombinase XerD
MADLNLNQWLKQQKDDDDSIEQWAEAFMWDKKAENVATGTIYFYRTKLDYFLAFCKDNDIQTVHEITPVVIRNYLIGLEEKGHNPGGVHCFYRVLRTFLYWWENETEPEDWRNPIRKVKAPKLSIDPLEPVPLDDVEKLIFACSGRTFSQLRDRAIMLFLLDTGIRASELCAIDLVDVEIKTGTVTIKRGKGRKPRTVFISKKVRRALRAYVNKRATQDKLRYDDALWVTKGGIRLTYWGLNEILRRRARDARVKKPGAHDFRRAFALNFFAMVAMSTLCRIQWGLLICRC